MESAIAAIASDSDPGSSSPRGSAHGSPAAMASRLGGRVRSWVPAGAFDSSFSQQQQQQQQQQQDDDGEQQQQQQQQQQQPRDGVSALERALESQRSNDSLPLFLPGLDALQADGGDADDGGMLRLRGGAYPDSCDSDGELPPDGDEAREGEEPAAPSSGGLYRVSIATAARVGAGTDGLATLRVLLAGSGAVDVAVNEARGELVEGGRVELSVHAPAAVAGDVAGAVLSHDGRGYASAWLPESVTIERLATGERH
jgi:hypothetical protein